MPDQEMMHGTISTTEQNLLVDVNAQDENRYLGKNGWTTLEDARRFSAEDAAKYQDGPGAYQGFVAESAAVALEAMNVEIKNPKEMPNITLQDASNDALIAELARRGAQFNIVVNEYDVTVGFDEFGKLDMVTFGVNEYGQIDTND
jgi:Trk K+ transport system NAD-binding subunit